MTGWKPDLKLTQFSEDTWALKSRVKIHTQYKFFVDGEWVLDEEKPKADDGHGHMNNIVTYGSDF